MIPNPDPVRPPLEVLTTIGQGALIIAIVARVAVAIAASWPLSVRAEWLSIGRSRAAVVVFIAAVLIGVIAAFIAVLFLL